MNFDVLSAKRLLTRYVLSVSSGKKKLNTRSVINWYINVSKPKTTPEIESAHKIFVENERILLLLLQWKVCRAPFSRFIGGIYELVLLTFVFWIQKEKYTSFLIS